MVTIRKRTVHHGYHREAGPGWLRGLRLDSREGARPKQKLTEVFETSWWPGTESNRRRQPFQGLLPNRLTGLESADVPDGKRVRGESIWHGLG
jgi:hypothetical protein